VTLHGENTRKQNPKTCKFYDLKWWKMRNDCLNRRCGGGESLIPEEINIRKRNLFSRKKRTPSA
jgi:hypothetical protein